MMRHEEQEDHDAAMDEAFYAFCKARRTLGSGKREALQDAVEAYLDYTAPYVPILQTEESRKYKDDFIEAFEGRISFFGR